jgi:hypothetical protein
MDCYVVKHEAVYVLFVMCLKCQDHRQIRVFVATRQCFAEAVAARVLGRNVENMCHVIQGFTDFRGVPQCCDVAKFSARFCAQV